MPVLRSLSTSAALALAAVGTLTAQQKAALSRPDAAFEEPFTSIRSIREIGPGKVLVSDQQDKIVQLVDLAAGAATRVGREGQGPGEYGFPGSLIPQPNGQTLLHDMINRRLLTIGPDGKPGELVELPRPPATATSSGPGFGGGFLFGPGEIHGDARGRIYFQPSPFRGPDQPPLDSAPIARWDRGRSRIDTLGWVKLAPNTMQVSGDRNRGTQVRIGGAKVFAPADAWGIAGDGRIARVTPTPYRVLWATGDGTWKAGPVQPYTPLKVTEADKEAVREARRRVRPTMIMMGGDGGRRVAPAPGPNPQIPEPEFEETKPPFEGASGAPAVQVSPEGEVWVLRTRPASDKTPSYDVFDGTGALVTKVTLNPRSRVIGFGQGTVYVVRTDEDDLQYLERYRKP